jgi:hypothetical protein
VYVAASTQGHLTLTLCTAGRTQKRSSGQVSGVCLCSFGQQVSFRLREPLRFTRPSPLAGACRRFQSIEAKQEFWGLLFESMWFRRGRMSVKRSS